MKDLADGSQSRRHTLVDWLALHELDPATCRGILGAMASEATGEPATQSTLNCGYQAPDLEVAWLRTVEAMRHYLIEQKSVIDDTFEKSARVLVEQPDNSGKALTLDNGPTAYPTIFFSYRGQPSDSLIIAHEFGHALQIRASQGRLVPPIVREVCAFLGEGALLSHTLQENPVQYAHLLQVWHRDNDKYFGAQRSRLQTALSMPDAPYKYSWNYPIARYLAMQISEQCSRDWIWRLFKGELSVREVLRDLAFSPS